jgi:RNA polymerase sigma factor (sigma-70 family)
MANVSRNAARTLPALDDARAAWPDARLVSECIGGSEEAWRALIFKYKNLIFSIPVKYGFTTDDSTDIFQAVCLDLLSELPKLRKVKALPKWIMQITAHKCFHRKQQQQRTEVMDPAAKEFEKSTPSRAQEILQEAEDEQSLRQAMAALPPRCRKLLETGSA